VLKRVYIILFLIILLLLNACGFVIFNPFMETTYPLFLPTVTVLNISANCQLETGFIIGTTSSIKNNVVLVEASFDGAAYTTAIGIANWKIPIPSGSSTWKKGSEHTIDVRAKDDAGIYSNVTSISIIMGTNKDVNGDGYADVGVGAHGYNSLTGRAYIFHGSSSGISTAPDTIITGESASDGFGRKITFGDINGDGYGDFLIYPANYPAGGWTGRIYIFFGQNTGIASANASTANTIIESPGSGVSFGHTIALGDINGDGYTDICASADSSDGKVYIFHGRTSWVSSLAASTDSNTLITGQAADAQCLGEGIGCGDINGDGYEDIAIGSPYYNSFDNTGQVYIFYGSSSGISSTDTTFANTTITGEATATRFGNSIFIGDINGDGFMDLTAAAEDYNTNYGQVYIFHGTPSGITDGIINTDITPNTILTGGGVDFWYGLSLAMGDVNRDGYMDIGVGAKKDTSCTGESYVYVGGSGGLNTTAIFTETGASTWHYMGYGIGFCDTNGDGYGDFIAGERGYNSFQGRFHVFNGNSSGLSGTASAIRLGETSPTADSSLGYSVTP